MEALREVWLAGERGEKNVGIAAGEIDMKWYIGFYCFCQSLPAGGNELRSPYCHLKHLL